MSHLQKTLLITLLLLIILFSMPHGVYASWVTEVLKNQELIPAGCTSGRQERGQCGVPEIMQLLFNITQLMLGVMGSAALLMFTYGGFLWIISAGKSQQVEKAKGILLNSIYGIIIILCAWIFVNFIVFALSGGTLEGIGQIFGQPWTNINQVIK